MSHRHISFLSVLCAAVFLTGAHFYRVDPVEPALGLWRGELTSPGGPLPFSLTFGKEHGKLAVYLHNGDERMKVDAVSVQGDSLFLEFPSFRSRLASRMVGPRLTGTLTFIKAGGRILTLPFKAELGRNYRFFEQSDADPTSVEGRWAVSFISTSGDTSTAIGEFAQKGARVTGTFLTNSGDHRFLEGEVNGDSLFLSSFDGSHAYLYKARLIDGNHLDGGFWSGSRSYRKWVARKNPDARLPDADRLTYLKPGYSAFDVTFPDLDGRKVSLSDPMFKDKVVIVTLSGTWCPNCHDEAALLTEYYRTYRKDGLEIVALMFEYSGDFESAVALTRSYRKRLGIDFTTLIAGVSENDDTATLLPALNAVSAFPTTLFIDRKGSVRRIHTGFDGPGTGEHYRKLQQDFRTTIEELLAE